MIEVQNLTKTFNGKTVLKDVSFEVKEGEIFGYLGPNGAGKTTTLRIILGLLNPTSGNAFVMGQNLGLGENEALRNKVGVLLEDDGVYDRLSAYENLDYYAQLYGLSDRIERKRRIRELLESVGLSDRINDKVGRFSKGMRRKLALARAIVHEPEVLFLDEPSSGLDPEAQIMVRDLILQLSEEMGVTIFLNSHDLDEVQRICTKIAILQSGEIKAHDTVKNLREKMDKPRVEITLSDSKDAEKALNILNSLDFVSVSDCERDDSRITAVIRNEKSSTILSVLMRNGIVVEEIKWVTKSLEDVYLDIVQKGREQNE
ncbi:ABC transporter ATP-binding protein [Methanosarcinales archaeon]|nr:ABC transporter ATP-binding protein [Methanophagales archaeon]MCW3139103.1 ABC transporter ATP-binding protein [Methanophagales archaeon]PXF53574.1 MAG: ABC transporter ATP-binding protein [Methanophagales archaeon]RLG33147.1 MAG: ABC transporter ATP-binding protein [Methanosarcinales archaeon]